MNKKAQSHYLSARAPLLVGTEGASESNLVAMMSAVVRRRYLGTYVAHPGSLLQDDSYRRHSVGQRTDQSSATDWCLVPPQPLTPTSLKSIFTCN